MNTMLLTMALACCYMHSAAAVEEREDLAEAARADIVSSTARNLERRLASRSAAHSVEGAVPCRPCQQGQGAGCCQSGNQIGGPAAPGAFGQVLVSKCGALAFTCKFHAAVENAEEKLFGDAKSAFTSAMDHVFTEDVSPLVDKINAAVHDAMQQVSDEVQATIDHAEHAVRDIIASAAKTANELASNITEDVENIIEQATDAMQGVENQFFADASKLLAQINQIVQKGQCMEAGGAKQIKDQIYKLLKQLNPVYRLSKCWRGLGYSVFRSLEDLTEMELYNYQKQCTLLNKITPNTPIDGPNGIEQTYAQGQLYAAEYYCIGETAGAPAFQDVFSREWVWWGVQYNAWRGQVRAAPPAAPSSPSAALIEPSAPIVASAPPPVLGGSGCGTPVECYAQAVKKLAQAEQMMSSLRAEADSNKATIVAIKAAVDSNKAEADSTITAIKAEADSNKAAIATNKAEVDSAISTLSSNMPRLTSCQQRYTPWNERGGTQFLDRHNVACGDGEVLQQFHLEATSNAFGIQETIRYAFTCCSFASVG